LISPNQHWRVRWLFVAYALFAAITPVNRGPVLCPFRRLTGHRCPLCGMTRATHALSRGRFSESVRHHPVAIPMWSGFVAWWIISRGRK